MTLVDVVRLVRHNALIIALCALLGAGAGAAFSLVQDEVYQATSKGYLVTGSGGSGSVNEALNANSLASLKVQQYLPLADTQAVHKHMADDLAQQGKGIQPGPFSVANIEGSGILVVTANSASPEAAQAIADAGVRAMAVEIRRLETLDASKIDEMASVEEIPTAGTASLTLVPYEPAALPTTPVSPDLRKNILIGLGAGLIIAAIIAWVRKLLDVRIRTTSDVEEVTGSSVLAVIPTASDLAKQRKNASGLAATGPSAEALRQLRTNLRFVNVDKRPRAIVVTSSNPGEGKSTVASNLARVLAESGQPVVLVDADLRRPMVATQFGIDGKIGLTQVLAGSVPLADALQPTETRLLRVLPAGRIPPNPSELVGSKHMGDLIQRLVVNHMVIVDAPPILPVTDAGLLTAHCDGALLVIRVGKTLKEQVKLSVKRLAQVQAKLLGSVINMASTKAMGEVVYGYGYGSKAYTSDYYSSKPEKRKKRHKVEKGEKGEDAVAFQPRGDLEPASPTLPGRARLEPAPEPDQPSAVAPQPARVAAGHEAFAPPTAERTPRRLRHSLIESDDDADGLDTIFGDDTSRP